MNQTSADRAASDAARIARRAYEIYEREGRPDGRAIEHWLQAEAELARESKRPLPSPLATGSASFRQPRPKRHQPVVVS